MSIATDKAIPTLNDLGIKVINISSSSSTSEIFETIFDIIGIQNKVSTNITNMLKIDNVYRYTSVLLKASSYTNGLLEYYTKNFKDSSPEKVYDIASKLYDITLKYNPTFGYELSTLGLENLKIKLNATYVGAVDTILPINGSRIGYDTYYGVINGTFIIYVDKSTSRVRFLPYVHMDNI